MKQQLEEIKSRAAAALANAKLPQEIDELRVRFLGKKGELTGILKQMGKLSPEERPVIGQLANEVRSWIETDIETRLTEIKASQMAARLESEKLDVTLPGKRPQFGAKHPLSIVLDEIKEIFIGMGFEIADGPEVETDYYNFEALDWFKAFRSILPVTLIFDSNFGVFKRNKLLSSDSGIAGGHIPIAV